MLILSLLLLSSIRCHINIKYFPQYSQHQKFSYSIQYFDQKISHFNYKYNSQTFKQKYLLDLSRWNKDQKGPILFYCGNEGPIQMFYNNTGFYNNVVADTMKGMLVYPQHRYFGVSMPFGDKNTSYLKQNLLYLTTEQALMDYVELIKNLKQTYCSDCPVIAFGGSYGGMLAAWIRIKYPFVVDMAHAASAPIYYYRNREGLDLSVFYKIVTKNYQMHSSNCADVIRQGFQRLVSYAKQSSGPIGSLSILFNLCQPLKTTSDIYFLIQYINNAYSYMAMLNYPYPTSFLKNLTSWPANSSCKPLDSVTPDSQDSALFSAIRESIQYYYSYNISKCNDIYSDDISDNDMSGWDILACADEAMPMNMNGRTDMFYPDTFDYKAYSQSCFSSFGIKPDYDYTLNHFGGVTDKEYLSATKIIFTNGGLDPWSGASPQSNLSDMLPACFIPQGAHHLDLRTPNPADMEDVIECRKKVINTLNLWTIKDQRKQMDQTSYQKAKKQKNMIQTQQ